MNLTILIHVPNEYSSSLRLILTIIFVIIAGIGLFGNSLVFLSITTNRLKFRHSPTNLLLVNMSCADLLILVFNIFDIVQFALDDNWPTAWHLGLSMCKIVRFIQVLGCYVSVQTLLIISIERYERMMSLKDNFIVAFCRYIAIIHPVKSSQINRRRRVCCIFILIWIIGFFAATPNLYLFYMWFIR